MTGKVKGQIHVAYDIGHLQPMSELCINFLHLLVSNIYPQKYYKGQGRCRKVRSKSHYELHTYTPNQYQLPSIIVLDLMVLRYNPYNILKVKVISTSHNEFVHLHKQAMSLPSINLLYLIV